MTDLHEYKTFFKWSSQIPATAAFGNGWWTSHSHNIETPHHCELNICLRVNKAQGLDVAIRKSSWDVLWQANIHLVVDQNTFSASTDKWSEYCTIFDVVKAERLVQYRVNRVLLDISCEITWLGLAGNFVGNKIRPPSPSIRHLDDFLTNNVFSDIILEFGGEKFPAHKIILGGQSPVFLKMLQAIIEDSSQQSSKNDKLVLHLPPDTHVDHMKVVLEYLYTGRDDALENVDIALKVLAIAESCEIEKLKRLCEYKLHKKLNINNVSMILDVADDYKAQDLRMRAINFIASNKSIMGLESFKQICLKKPSLSFQIFSNMVSE